MQETYNIYFAGEIADGESLEDVRRRVGALFNARDATLDKLFSGRTQLIKRNCSHDEALKYQAAMQRAGALATITPTDTDANAAAGSQPGRSTAKPAARTASAIRPDTGLTLAPAGADVLQPDERRSATARDIDLSAFSVAPSGERLGVPAPEAPPAPDTSHISAAEIGDALPTLATAVPPPPPDTAGLSLADPDTELLEERYRNHSAPPAPQTDHLSVEPRDHD